MADARRFPRLELPFALVGAAGGFLSTSLASNPMVATLPRGMQPVAVVAGAIVGAITGAAARKLCVGRRYAYRLDEPDATARATGDSAAAHTVLVLLAGAIIGACVGAACNTRYATALAAISGVVCALVFLPVALAVVRFARAAQRARLGTLVARADRRAVWSILATTLALTTLEALPDWHLRREGCVVAVTIAFVCSLVVLGALVADTFASRRARGALADLAAPSPFAHEAPSVIDLGLGDGVGARVARGTSAYRDRDRTLALVRGDAVAVRRAASRALVRGRASLALVTAVLGVHALAAYMMR